MTMSTATPATHHYQVDLTKPIPTPIEVGFTSQYPYPLDPFQEWAIYALANYHDVLVTVPTSCGKTVIAEYCIYEALQNQTKVIYTSPIKTLSNQKFAELRAKFGSESIGIMTGDIKFNPDAPVLVMTTEILHNQLIQVETIRRTQESTVPMTTTTTTIDDGGDDESSKSPTAASSVAPSSFLDQVSSIVFDEVHYINDRDRGYIWEECLMFVPTHIKLALLSATIGNADEMATWLTKIRGGQHHHRRQCYLISHQDRPVKLSHQFYQPHRGKFINYDPISYEHYLYPKETNTKRIISTPQRYQLDDLVKDLKESNKLPALFFVFSRKNCEKYANQLTLSLLHDDGGGNNGNNDDLHRQQAEVKSTIDRMLFRYQYDLKSLQESTQIIEITKLAMKGIGYHHANLLPVSKEIVEVLFSKQLIKVLFATETFSVGVNMPTRSVVFLDFTKTATTNGERRTLLTSEFYQMAGRAGRRGLDKEGDVIYAPINRNYMIKPFHLRKMMEGAHPVLKGQYDESHYKTILRQTLLQLSITDIRTELLRSFTGRMKTSEKDRKDEEELMRISSRIDELLLITLPPASTSAAATAIATPAVTITTTESNEEEHAANVANVSTTIVDPSSSLIRQQLDPIQRDLLQQYLVAVTTSTSASSITNNNEHLKDQMRSAGLMGKKRILARYQPIFNQLVELDELKRKRESMLRNNSFEVLQQIYDEHLKSLAYAGFLHINNWNVWPLKISVTTKGKIAYRINRANGLLVGTLLDQYYYPCHLKQLTLNELAILFHLITVNDNIGSSGQSYQDGDDETSNSIYHSSSIVDAGADVIVDQSPPPYYQSYLKVDNILEKALMQLRSQFYNYPSTPKYAPYYIPSLLLWLEGKSFNETVRSISSQQGGFVRAMLNLLHFLEELNQYFTSNSQHHHNNEGYLELELRVRQLIPLINREMIIFDSIYIK